MAAATSQPAGFAAGLTTGLARVARGARAADLPDPIEVVRAIDLPRRVDVGRELAADAAAAIAETVTEAQARRRRSRRRRILTALAVGLVVALAMPAWRGWRRMSERAARERALDRMGVERAAGEGMGTAIGSPARPTATERVPVAMEMAAADEPAAAIDDIRHERLDRTVIDQSKVGIGVPRA
jgi:hypothetical protein